MKALAKATDTSVNDVVMTIIDDALHHYLSEHQAPTDMPLVAFMPMSLRDESGGGGGNQVSAELIPMGAPEASPLERLKEINTATTSAKDKGRGMQTTSRQAYALLLFGSLTMSDTVPWLGKVPSANLVISNMKGPTEQLYLAGAPMVAFTWPAHPAARRRTQRHLRKHQHRAVHRHRRGAGSRPRALPACRTHRASQVQSLGTLQIDSLPPLINVPTTPNIENPMKNIGAMLRQRATVSPRLEAYVEPSDRRAHELRRNERTGEPVRQPAHLTRGQPG